MKESKRDKWPEPLYTPAQKKWCIEYESLTDFEPLMSDYEAGRQSFRECARASVRWYELHTADMHLRVSSMLVPDDK